MRQSCWSRAGKKGMEEEEEEAMGFLLAARKKA